MCMTYLFANFVSKVAKLMQFYISAYFQDKEYCLKVEKTKSTREMAEYRVSGKNRSIILQTDAPFLRAKAVNFGDPSWKLVSGSPPAKGLLESIVQQLEIYEGNKR
jgi:hypothetical protein